MILAHVSLRTGSFPSNFFWREGADKGILLDSLFILAIEPLAMDIKSNNNIKGIKIENDQCKMGQYADDTFFTGLVYQEQ